MPGDFIVLRSGGELSGGFCFAHAQSYQLGFRPIRADGRAVLFPLRSPPKRRWRAASRLREPTNSLTIFSPRPYSGPNCHPPSETDPVSAIARTKADLSQHIRQYAGRNSVTLSIQTQRICQSRALDSRGVESKKSIHRHSRRADAAIWRNPRIQQARSFQRAFEAGTLLVAEDSAENRNSRQQGAPGRVMRPS